MLKYVNRINKKLIYKLHLENDKIIDMPMFLVDSLYIRNKEELIGLLNTAITFDKNNFLYNYKRVLLKNENNKLSENYNPYKYDNEEYNELINHLSEINECDENYNDVYFYENELHPMDRTIEKGIVEGEQIEDYIQCLDSRKKVENKNMSREREMLEYYSLMGYVPNNFFFYNYKNRIISLIDNLSYSDIFSLIYLYSKSSKVDFSMINVLGKQYINRMEKDKQVDYKNMIKLLNIFIKLSYKQNEMQYIIQKLLKNLCVCTYSEDLKIATLHFVCLSKLNLYNILFYDYIDMFLKNVNTFSHLSCSIILQCLGYYRYHLIRSSNYIFKLVRQFKQRLVNETGEGEEEAKQAEWKHILRNKIDTQILIFQHRRKNIDLINDIENRIIYRLTKINLDDISEKSIGSIFHFYYLINKKILTDRDHLLFSNLVNVLIKNKIDFQKPRSFLMSSYTLIIHKYFTNINISSYFLLQCAKLIKLLKTETYMSNLLFVLMGFSQNQLIFYKNKSNNKKTNLDMSGDNVNDNYPEVYIDKKYNKLCNFKIENKFKDMTEMCEYKINILEDKSFEPVSCRSAILSIFNEITNLEYKLNNDQMRMYLLLFSSFDIKLSSEIKQKILSLIINDSKSLIHLAHTVIQTAVKIFGISSSYMKTICLSLLEQMDFEIVKLYKATKRDEAIQDDGKKQQCCNYLYDLNILSEILFVFDQIDITKNDFIINIINLMFSNNFLIFKYKKNSFSSYVYFLHYIGSNKINTEIYKKVCAFIFANLSDYIDLSYKFYLKNNVEQVANMKDINGFNKTNVYKSTESDIFFDEVDHKLIMDNIYVKDILLLLDAIRILKAYSNVPLISNLVAMLNTDKIKALSDEDIELANYIFIDMGLPNKYIMDEAKNRGLTIGLK
ncbi:conserved Plasmodium protein, unknown function [Plasmodium chabaudi adami]|uniref:Uncharacterized protein n=1 Tax=Plasmodium chabaudi adami TaxID=5826 RepID=A0A1C6X8P8_PLACE|nr:conserved Plasmodium protein, unknown function [Plasmodium chabaudi adami]